MWVLQTYSGDIELAGYLANVTGPVSLVLDLHIVHQRFGSSSDPNLNGNLHYPNDIDRSLNEAAADKIGKYRADYDNNPRALMISPLFLLLLVRLGGYMMARPIWSSTIDQRVLCDQVHH
jgi:hypothetical protein